MLGFILLEIQQWLKRERERKMKERRGECIMTFIPSERNKTEVHEGNVQCSVEKNAKVRWFQASLLRRK